MKRALSVVLSVILMMSMLLSMPAASTAAATPKATSIAKLTAQVNGFKVQWKKVSADGYQIAYATKKSFNNQKKKSVGASVKAKTVKGLKGKTRYYVKVRAFYEKNGERTYGKWSKVRYVTTKKATKKPAPTGQIVYITPTGSKYHYSKACAGKNAMKRNLSEVKGSYGPCKKCAGG